MASAVHTDISSQCKGDTTECMGQTQNTARHDDAQLAGSPGVQAVTHRCKHHSLKAGEGKRGGFSDVYAESTCYTACQAPQSWITRSCEISCIDAGNQTWVLCKDRKARQERVQSGGLYPIVLSFLRGKVAVVIL